MSVNFIVKAGLDRLSYGRVKKMGLYVTVLFFIMFQMREKIVKDLKRKKFYFLKEKGKILMRKEYSGSLLFFQHIQGIDVKICFSWNGAHLYALVKFIFFLCKASFYGWYE